MLLAALLSVLSVGSHVCCACYVVPSLLRLLAELTEAPAPVASRAK